MSLRSTIRTHADRSVPQEAARILAQGHVAHVGFVQEGQPYVIPLGYQYSPATPDRLYVHGSPGSRLMRHLATGAPVCVTVTLLDGLVYSRTALYHSMNYRSAVCFGRGRRVTDEAVQRDVFQAMVSRYFPGRRMGRDYTEPTPEHMDATVLIEVEIEEWSAKTRLGGPLGPLDAEEDGPGTRGWCRSNLLQSL
jgi:nitroimidazol reductase NimA-like FMN-containing flavoprotein (pyridoxamine 5'-phosphate oxidase superfamily)